MAGAGDWGRSMNPRGKGWGGGWLTMRAKGREERRGADTSRGCRRVADGGC